MAVKRNITVAIDSSVLKKARALAARRGQSVSALIADKLGALVSDDAAYSAAHKRALSLFANPLRLGGKPMLREELHDRRGLR